MTPNPQPGREERSDALGGGTDGKESLVMPDTPVRTAVRVEGIVQGVGFRPFVYSLASRLGLGGVVGNDVDGGFAEGEVYPAAVREFLLALSRDAPPLARVERVTAAPLGPAGTVSFQIVASESAGR